MHPSVADFAYDGYKENAMEDADEESKRSVIVDTKSRHRCDKCSFRTDNAR
jgi:hypothetical protein